MNNIEKLRKAAQDFLDATSDIGYRNQEKYFFDWYYTKVNLCSIDRLYKSIRDENESPELLKLYAKIKRSGPFTPEQLERWAKS